MLAEELKSSIRDSTSITKINNQIGELVIRDANRKLNFLFFCIFHNFLSKKCIPLLIKDKTPYCLCLCQQLIVFQLLIRIGLLYKLLIVGSILSSSLKKSSLLVPDLYMSTANILLSCSFYLNELIFQYLKFLNIISSILLPVSTRAVANIVNFLLFYVSCSSKTFWHNQSSWI